MSTFKSYGVLLYSYTIRSSNLNPLEGLKSWIIEGSNDKLKWFELDSHLNVESLCNAKAVESFIIEDYVKNNKPFRYIQIRMIGLNSNNNYSLSIANIEFFGKYTNNCI